MRALYGEHAEHLVDMLVAAAHARGHTGLAHDLTAKRRSLPHKLERADYVLARNPEAKDGLWVIDGRRAAVYALKTETLHRQLSAAVALM